MIKVKLFTKENSIKAIEIKGHAFYDEYGHDIVCAAVSMLTYNTIDTFTDLLDMKDNISYTIDENRIYLEIDLELDDEKNRINQLILKKFELGIKSLVKHYGDFIKLDYMEV